MLKILFITLVVLLVAACTTGGENSGTTTADSAGIHVVTYKGPERIIPYAASPLRAFGGADSGALAFSSLVESLVRTDAAGNIYVLDTDAQSVSVIDWEKGGARSVGRRGAGPGELEFPLSLTSKTDSGFFVFDFAKGGLLEFSKEGAFIALHRTPGVTPNDRIEAIESGVVFTSSRRAHGDSLETLLNLTDGDSTRVIDSLTLPVAVFVDFAACGMRVRHAPVFSPQLVWTVRGSRLIVADPGRYEISVYDAGRLSSIVRRPVQPRSATETLAAQEIGDSLRAKSSTASCAIPAATAVTQRGVSDVIPSISKLAIARDGTIWVLRGAVRGEEKRIDLYDTNGIYLGTISTLANFPVDFLPAGNPVTIISDSASGINRVAVMPQVVR